MPQIHGNLRKERALCLRALGEKATQRHYESLIGKTVEVLVENNGIGCTPQFAKLKLIGEAPVGQIVDARCARGENGEVVAKVGNNS
jgi:threonylcarbamoyladenosine tRNA methylthiotransferase MtaB